MIEIPGGVVLLRDEARNTGWTVEIEPFLLAAHPVTREEFHGVPGDRRPVTDVSWFDARDYCERHGFRLPTEAEWEYACRAGSRGDRYGDLDAIAWHAGNGHTGNGHTGDGHGEVREVGLKEPNAWGLHDMIGNVWEWTSDLYDPEVYGEYRVFRGGGAHDGPRALRASCRRKSHPTFKIDDLGFRVARSMPRTAA